MNVVKEDGRGSRPFTAMTITRFLLKIVIEKVVTETDMLKSMGSMQSITASYKCLRKHGFPIRRRLIDERASQRSSRKLQKHRTMIYYME